MAVLAASAAAACNDNHIVSGAKCSAGVENGEGTGQAGEAPAATPRRVFPIRPIAAHVFHSSAVSANAASSDAVPANASQLLDAMDVTSTLAAEGETVTSSSLTDVSKQAAAFMGLGSVQPVTGPSFAWLSTGVAGSGTAKALDPLALGTQPGDDMGGAGCNGVTDSYDCVTLTFSFVTPSDAHALAFDFNFMSAEYPEYVGSIFNDTFQVSLASASHNYANIVYDHSGNPITINNVYFTAPCQSVAGTGFDITDFFGDCDAGATGLLTTSA
ncbi:MAG TPA: choice-of-anchor L domain-containing protein, partial [bacterium]|nr:choice-of-anchor L domain-containing protein [bacterium]